jgi:hypothetical protein
MGRAKELRCECSRRPLLALYGRGRDGKPFIHMKVFKGRRLYAEAVFTEGVVRLHCRECLHWTTVRIVPLTEPTVKQENLPAEIPASMLADTRNG